MRTCITCLAVALMTLTPPLQAQNPLLQMAMREKLADAQGLLEGLVRGDFARMDRAAERLGRITDAEIVSWHTTASPVYSEFAQQFLLSVDGLRTAAADRNLADVLLEYTTMVTVCTNCHSYVRDAVRAD